MVLKPCLQDCITKGVINILSWAHVVLLETCEFNKTAIVAFFTFWLTNKMETFHGNFSQANIPKIPKYVFQLRARRLVGNLPSFSTCHCS